MSTCVVFKERLNWKRDLGVTFAMVSLRLSWRVLMDYHGLVRQAMHMDDRNGPLSTDAGHKTA